MSNLIRTGSCLWTACASLLVVSALASTPLARQQPAAARGDVNDGVRQYDGGDYENAKQILDGVIADLQPRSQDDAIRGDLIRAYEYRARARYALKDSDGARSDFDTLLKLDPGHELGSQVQANARAFFADIQKAAIGSLALTVDPPDADVRIEGRPLAKTLGLIPLYAGQHTVTGQRKNYRPDSRPITITPGEATSLALHLERESVTVSIVTVPAEVEVWIDGAKKGETPKGPPPSDYPGVASLAQPRTASGPLEVEVSTGTGHSIEFRKACYLGEGRAPLPAAAADVKLAPKMLRPAFAFVNVRPVDGALGVVYIDQKSVPLEPSGTYTICETNHTVEVRSTYGRDILRLDPSAFHPGDTMDFRANLRPAVAVLSTTNRPQGLRAADPRQAIETRLQNARSLRVFAPPAGDVDRLLSSEKLQESWLSFDEVRSGITELAKNSTPSSRQVSSTNLATALDVQAVAEIRMLSNDDPPDVLFTLLAAGSGQPDTLRIKLSDRNDLDDAIRRLDSTPHFLRRSAGVQVADAHDVEGAVVLRVEGGGPASQAGLAPGDLIVSVNGQKTANGSSFATLVSNAKPDDRLILEVRGTAGAIKRPVIQVADVPQVIGLFDQSLLPNRLIMEYRGRLLRPRAEERAALELNLGIALMQVESWKAAKVELDKVDLPDGPGISRGTVQYLIGTCLDGLGDRAGADAAFRQAAASPDALLTTEGPAIKELLSARAQRSPGE